MYTCRVCRQSWNYKYFYNKHLKEGKCPKKQSVRNQSSRHQCSICKQSFKRKATLMLHYKFVHDNEETFKCLICDKLFFTRASFRLHREEHQEDEVQQSSGFIREKTAHTYACQQFVFRFGPSINTIQKAFTTIAHPFKKLIKHQLVKRKSIKVSLILEVKMVKAVEGGRPEEEVEGKDTITVPFRSECLLYGRFSNLESNFARTMHHIQSAADEFLAYGSGWTEDRVISARVEIVECKPLAGSCTLHYLQKLRKSKGQTIITGKNKNFFQDGHHCFFLALAAYFLPPNEHTKEKLEEFIVSNFDTTGIETPVKLEDVELFEKKHEQLDLSINNIYRDDEGSYFPVKASENIKAKHVIVLMLFFCGKNTLHYALVQDPGKIISNCTN